ACSATQGTTMWERQDRYWAAFCFVVYLTLAAVVLTYCYQDAMFFLWGVSTPAKVTDVEVRQAGFEPYDPYGQGGNPYYEQRLRYEYQDAAGSPFTGEAVTRSSKMLPSYHQGQAVNVQYRKDAPGISRIAPVGVWSTWKLALAVVVLMGG